MGHEESVGRSTTHAQRHSRARTLTSERRNSVGTLSDQRSRTAPAGCRRARFSWRPSRPSKVGPRRRRRRGTGSEPYGNRVESRRGTASGRPPQPRDESLARAGVLSASMSTRTRARESAPSGSCGRVFGGVCGPAGRSPGLELTERGAVRSGGEARRRTRRRIRLRHGVNPRMRRGLSPGMTALRTRERRAFGSATMDANVVEQSDGINAPVNFWVGSAAEVGLRRRPRGSRRGGHHPCP
jgi:hypothetical protein